MSKKVKNEPLANDNEWIEEEFSSFKKEDFASSTGVQLSPIVQPIAFVPYNTQEQPLFQYGSSYDLDRAREDIAREFETEEEGYKKKAPIEKKVRFLPIFLSILSLLIVGVLVLGEFALQEYLILTADTSGYAYVMQIVDTLTAGGELVIAELIVPGAVALIAVFAVINLIANLIKMKSKGACAISKICLFFMLTLSLVLVLVNMINDEVIGYGLYAVAGLSLISLVFGYLAKKDIK